MEKLGIFKRVIPTALTLGLFLLSSVAVFAADKIKSTSFFSGTMTDLVSSPVSLSLSVYIGDNLLGITDPVKTAFIQVSGSYSGSGTLGVSLDGDVTSLQNFTLPAVTKPTKFEIVYKDTGGKLNHSSAGNYEHQIDLDPSGVSVSGLAATAHFTIQYSADICDDGQPSAEKVKTTYFFVLSSESEISTPLTTPFQLYLGDELTGITDPVKSVLFEVSGTYTGGGTLGLSLNSDPGTLKTIDLPTVTEPTFFSFDYQDASDIINPTSAGIFSYDFNLIPSGVSISSASVVAHVTHQYQPPACGTGYPPYGDLTSAVIQAPPEGVSPAYNSIFWKGTLGGPSQNKGKVKFRFAASDNPAGPWTDADFVGGNNCLSTEWLDTVGPDQPVEIKCFSELNNKKYFRYKVRVCAEDCIIFGQYTPTVNDIVINWSP